MQRQVLVAPPGAGVGAHADVTVRELPLHRPFAHRLREQRDRRHQVEDPAAGAGVRLGDSQRGEGLAGPARHHQLAAVVRAKALRYVAACAPLVRAQFERRAEVAQLLRRGADEVGPVERVAGEVVEPQRLAYGLRRGDDLSRVRPPSRAGVDEDAGGERVAARGGDERVDMRLRHAGVRRVAFALDGADPARALLGDEVDADIGAVETRPPRRPFAPQPDAGEPLAVERVLLEERLHQPFEQPPLGGFRIGGGAYPVEDPLKPVDRHRRPPPPAPSGYPPPPAPPSGAEAVAFGDEMAWRSGKR